jgi:hypothetical protein
MWRYRRAYVDGCRMQRNCSGKNHQRCWHRPAVMRKSRSKTDNMYVVTRDIPSRKSGIATFTSNTVSYLHHISSSCTDHPSRSLSPHARPLRLALESFLLSLLASILVRSEEDASRMMVEEGCCLITGERHGIRHNGWCGASPDGMRVVLSLVCRPNLF